MKEHPVTDRPEAHQIWMGPLAPRHSLGLARPRIGIGGIIAVMVRDGDRQFLTRAIAAGKNALAVFNA